MKGGWPDPSWSSVEVARGHFQFVPCTTSYNSIVTTPFVHPPEIPSKTRFSFHALCQFGRFFKSSKIVLRFGFWGMNFLNIPLGRPRRNLNLWFRLWQSHFAAKVVIPGAQVMPMQVPRLVPMLVPRLVLRWCLGWCPDWCSGAQVGRPPPQYIPKSSALPAYTACSFRCTLVVAAHSCSTVAHSTAHRWSRVAAQVIARVTLRSCIDQELLANDQSPPANQLKLIFIFLFFFFKNFQSAMYIQSNARMFRPNWISL